MSGFCNACEHQLEEDDLKCPECGLEVLVCLACSTQFTIDTHELELCESCITEGMHRGEDVPDVEKD